GADSPGAGGRSVRHTDCAHHRRRDHLEADGLSSGRCRPAEPGPAHLSGRTLRATVQAGARRDSRSKRSRVHVGRGLGGPYGGIATAVRDTARETRTIYAAPVDVGFFELVGLTPLAGRFFSE